MADKDLARTAEAAFGDAQRDRARAPRSPTEGEPGEAMRTLDAGRQAMSENHMREPGETEIDPGRIFEVYQQGTLAENEALFRMDAIVKAQYGYTVRSVITTGHTLGVIYVRGRRGG